MSERKQRIWRFIKTSVLALAITFLLVTLVANSKNKSAKESARPQNRALEQRISVLEKALRENREQLRETKETNRTLREMLSELRGIHNDCQRNATENFLRRH